MTDGIQNPEWKSFDGWPLADVIERLFRDYLDDEASRWIADCRSEGLSGLPTLEIVKEELARHNWSAFSPSAGFLHIQIYDWARHFPPPVRRAFSLLMHHDNIARCFGAASVSLLNALGGDLIKAEGMLEPCAEHGWKFSSIPNGLMRHDRWALYRFESRLVHLRDDWQETSPAYRAVRIRTEVGSETSSEHRQPGIEQSRIHTEDEGGRPQKMQAAVRELHAEGSISAEFSQKDIYNRVVRHLGVVGCKGYTPDNFRKTCGNLLRELKLSR